MPFNTDAQRIYANTMATLEQLENSKGVDIAFVRETNTGTEIKISEMADRLLDPTSLDQFVRISGGMFNRG